MKLKPFDWRFVPPFIYFLLAKSDLVIAYAIIKYRQTENETWRQFARWLIEYAFLADGTQWDANDLTL